MIGCLSTRIFFPNEIAIGAQSSHVGARGWLSQSVPSREKTSGYQEAKTVENEMFCQIDTLN